MKREQVMPSGVLGQAGAIPERRRGSRSVASTHADEHPPVLPSALHAAEITDVDLSRSKAELDGQARQGRVKRRLSRLVTSFMSGMATPSVQQVEDPMSGPVLAVTMMSMQQAEREENTQAVITDVSGSTAGAAVGEHTDEGSAIILEAAQDTSRTKTGSNGTAGSMLSPNNGEAIAFPSSGEGHIIDFTVRSENGVDPNQLGFKEVTTSTLEGRAVKEGDIDAIIHDGWFKNTRRIAHLFGDVINNDTLPKNWNDSRQVDRFRRRLLEFYFPSGIQERDVDIMVKDKWFMDPKRTAHLEGVYIPEDWGDPKQVYAFKRSFLDFYSLHGVRPDQIGEVMEGLKRGMFKDQKRKINLADVNEALPTDWENPEQVDKLRGVLKRHCSGEKFFVEHAYDENEELISHAVVTRKTLVLEKDVEGVRRLAAITSWLEGEEIKDADGNVVEMTTGDPWSKEGEETASHTQMHFVSEEFSGQGLGLKLAIERTKAIFNKEKIKNIVTWVNVIGNYQLNETFFTLLGYQEQGKEYYNPTVPLGHPKLSMRRYILNREQWENGAYGYGPDGKIVRVGRDASEIRWDLKRRGYTHHEPDLG